MEQFAPIGNSASALRGADLRGRPSLDYLSLLKSLARDGMHAAADVVALQLAIQGRAADAQHLPGQGFVAFDLLKNALDGGALDIFQVGGRELAGRTRIGYVPALGGGGEGRRQIV